MTSLGRRLKRIEAVLRLGSDANGEMTRLALGCVSDGDLDFFQDIVEYGKQANQGSEREAITVTMYTRAFEQAVQIAGYATIREFERRCGTCGKWY